jgi:hypothetical protein
MVKTRFRIEKLEERIAPSGWHHRPTPNVDVDVNINTTVINQTANTTVIALGAYNDASAKVLMFANT